MSTSRKFMLGAVAYVLASTVVYAYTISSGVMTLAPDIVYLLAPTVAVLCFGAAYLKVGTQGARSRIVALLLIGVLCSWLAEVVFVILKMFNLSPYPSVADVFFLLSYPFMFAGLFLEYRLARVKIDSRRLPALVAIVVLLVALVSYFDVFLAYDPAETLAANIISSLYGVGDVVLLLMVILVWLVARGYKGGQLVFALWPMATGLALYFVADTIFALFEFEYDASSTVYTLYNVIDLLWIFGYLLIGYSAVAYLEVLKKVRRFLSLPSSPLSGR